MSMLRHLVVAHVVLGSLSTASAQLCAGFAPDSRGFFAAGQVGTDGASGSGLTFGYQRPRGAVIVERRSMDLFAAANPYRSSSIHVTRAFRGRGTCLSAGIQRSSFNTELAGSITWDSQNPNVIVEHHDVGGDYSGFWIPVGLTFARQREVLGFTAVPYFNPFAIYESERFESQRVGAEKPRESRRAVGPGFAAGLTLRRSWFLARASLWTKMTHDRALSGRNNSPHLGLHLGVVF